VKLLARPLVSELAIPSVLVRAFEKKKCSLTLDNEVNEPERDLDHEA